MRAIKAGLVAIPLFLWAAGIASAQSPVQWQAVNTAINNIQSQLNTLTQKVNGITVASTTVTNPHLLAQVTPSITLSKPTTTAGKPVIDEYTLQLTQNMSSPIQLPASTAVQDGQLIETVIQQGASNFTMAAGDASSFFVHGAGTSITNLAPNGCPTIGSANGALLHATLYYFAAATTYIILDCTPTGSIFPPPTNVTAQTGAAVTLDMSKTNTFNEALTAAGPQTTTFKPINGYDGEMLYVTACNNATGTNNWAFDPTGVGTISYLYDGGVLPPLTQSPGACSRIWFSLHLVYPFMTLIEEGRTPILPGVVLANDATATVVNDLVKLTSTGTVTSAITTDTDGIIGVCIAGCGSSGLAYIQTFGIVSLNLDGATTSGHFIANSSTVNGQGHDAGATRPVSSVPVAFMVDPTSGGAGLHQVLLTIGAASASATPTTGCATISHLGATVPVDVGNTTTETTIFSGTVPGNTLGVNGCVNATIDGDLLYHTGNNADVITVKLKDGATVMATSSSSGYTDSASRRGFTARAQFCNANATNVQNGNVYGQYGPIALSSAETAGTAIDTTASQTYTVTFTWSGGATPSASDDVKIYGATLCAVQ